jgi:L-iditol 2-dehydrogenase
MEHWVAVVCDDANNTVKHPLKTLKTVTKPAPLCPADGALLTMQGCGLCGSDLEKLGPLRYAPNQTVLGHEVVGHISALGERYTGLLKLGQRIIVSHHVPCLTCHYCMCGQQSMCRQFKATNLQPGGMASTIAISAQHLQHTTFTLPNTVPLADGICVEPLACVLKALRLTGITITPPSVPCRPQKALVIGLGFIGLVAMQAYQVCGWQTYGIERSQARLDWINQTPELNIAATQVGLTTNDFSLGIGVDTVFLTVVTPQTLTMALQNVRDGGTIVLFAAPTSTSPQIDLSPLYYREIRIVPSYSPNLEDLQAAHTWVLNQTIALSPLVNVTVSLAAITQGVTQARNGGAIKVLITP